MENDFTRERRPAKEGVDYEDHILAHLAIVCATHKDVKDFTITGNAKEITKVDDVVLHVCNNKDDTWELFGFQIKHINVAGHRGLFGGDKCVFESFEKYASSYQTLKEKFPQKKITIILWTNYSLTSHNSLKRFDGASSLVNQFCATGTKVYEINRDGTELRSSKNLKDFKENCLVIPNQPNIENTSQLIKQELGNDIFPETYHNIVNYFKESEAPNFNKTHIVQTLIYLILTPCLQWNDEISNNQKELPNFDIIINTLNNSVLFIKNSKSVETLQLAMFHFIQKEFGLPRNFKWDDQLPQDVLESVIKIPEIEKHAKLKNKWKMLCYKDLVFLLWTIGKLPLLFSYSNKTQYDIIRRKIEDKYLKGFVVVNDEEIEECSVFSEEIQNHLDMSAIRFTFNNKTEISLKDLADQDENIIKAITPDVYLNLMADKNYIGHHTSDICNNYIPRSIDIVIFGKKVLQEKTVLFIVDKEIEGSMDLSDYVRNSQQNGNGNILHSKESQYDTVKEIKKLSVRFCCLCEYKDEYICYAGNEEVIKNLIHTEYRSTKSRKEIELIQSEFPVDFCVVNGNAGMGKTEFLLSLKKAASDEIWTIYLNLGIHAKQLNKIVENGESSFFEYLIKIHNDNVLLNNFYYKLLQNRLNKRKVILLLDGYDEIQLSHKVLDMAASLKFRIILTTRNFKIPELQSLFNILPMNLKKFETIALLNYLKMSLNNFDDELIDDIYKKLQETLYDELIGVPLLAKLFVDIFDSPAKYKDLKDDIDILYLYEHFFKKHIPEIKSLKETEIQELATHLLIKSEKLLENLVIDVDRLNRVAAKFEKDHKKEFIITGFTYTHTGNSLPIFVHRSYAEFSCAQLLYLKKNKEHFHNVYEVLHSREDLFQVRYYFNLLVCRNMPLHYSILIKNRKITDNFLKRIHDKDELNRNILHLICGFGLESFNRPTFKKGNQWCDQITVQRFDNPLGVDLISVRTIAERINSIGIDQFLTTDHFGKTPFEYSFNTLCLDQLDQILNMVRTEVPRPLKHEYTMFYIIVRFKLNNILKNAHPESMEAICSTDNFFEAALQEIQDSLSQNPNKDVLQVAAYYDNRDAIEFFIKKGPIKQRYEGMSSSLVQHYFQLICKNEKVDLTLLKLFLHSVWWTYTKLGSQTIIKPNNKE